MIEFEEQDAPPSGLDLTPMLDVVFLLLIFFLLTSIFSRSSLPLDLPRAATAVNTPEKEITVTLLAGGGITVNGRPERQDALATALAARLAAGAEPALALNAEKYVPFWRVVQAMDAARQAGIDKMAVGTERAK